MSNALLDLLAERGHLIADGAMGTNLFALGLETGNSPELWNVEAPEKVATVHRGFLRRRRARTRHRSCVGAGGAGGAPHRRPV